MSEIKNYYYYCLFFVDEHLAIANYVSIYLYS